MNTYALYEGAQASEDVRSLGGTRGTRLVCIEDFRRDTIVVTGMAVSDRRPWQVTACGQHASVSSLSAVCKAGSVHILKWRYATLDTQEIKIAFL